MITSQVILDFFIQVIPAFQPVGKTRFGHPLISLWREWKFAESSLLDAAQKLGTELPVDGWFCAILIMGLR